MTGLLRIESQIPQLVTAVIGFLIGYYVDQKIDISKVKKQCATSIQVSVDFQSQVQVFL